MWRHLLTDLGRSPTAGEEQKSWLDDLMRHATSAETAAAGELLGELERPTTSSCRASG